MPTTYNLLPNPQWRVVDANGNPLVGGLVYTYQAGTRIAKATYNDIGGVSPKENPFSLDSKGEARVYWADDTGYYIEVRDSSGQLVYSCDNYQAAETGGGGSVTNNVNFDNYIRNPQLSFWPKGDMYDLSNETDDVVFSEWSFAKSNTNGTDNLTKEIFNLGQSNGLSNSVPFNPIYYANFQCTSTGGESYKYFYQEYESVQTLQDTQVTISAYFKSSTASQIEYEIVQNFGTGGSPSAEVVTPIASHTLTNEWARYSSTYTFPSVVTKTLGTNGDDKLILRIKMPANTICNIDFTEIQMQLGAAATDFQYFTLEEQRQKIFLLAFPTGWIQPTYSSTAPLGWIMAEDGTIGSVSSNATNLKSIEARNLFILIWNISSNSDCPILDSGGSPSTRGSSAEADFAADKQLTLPKLKGRVLLGSGTGSGLTNRVICSSGGEEEVTLLTSNLPPHQHGYTKYSELNTRGSGSSAVPYWGGTSSDATTDGSEYGLNSTPFSIMNPFGVVNYMIKL